LSTKKMPDPRSTDTFKSELARVVPIALTGAVLGITSAFIVLAHPVDPFDPPLPVVEHAPLARIAQSDGEIRRRIDALPPPGMPAELRAIGKAYLDWNAAAADAPMYGDTIEAATRRRQLGEELRASLAVARKALGEQAADEQLRQLRAFHCELFLGELAKQSRSGVRSVELDRLAGALLDVLAKSGWVAPSGAVSVPSAILRARYKLHWTSIVFGLEDCEHTAAQVCYGVTALPLDPAELRALLAFLVAHPVLRDGDEEEAGSLERALERRRLVYLERLSTIDRFLDPEGKTHPYLGNYPVDLARGAMLFKLGQYPEAEAVLRKYSSTHRDDSRARNWFLAAMAKNHPEY
jgi:hypothetical protein